MRGDSKPSLDHQPKKSGFRKKTLERPVFSEGKDLKERRRKVLGRSERTGCENKGRSKKKRSKKGEGGVEPPPRDLQSPMLSLHHSPRQPTSIEGKRF
jgi:hypothetical protein